MQKRDWPSSPPRQDSFGRGFHSGGRGSPWSGKRSRVDPRAPWGRGRGPADGQQAPRFGGGPRRGSPPLYDEPPHRAGQGHRGPPPAWSAGPGTPRTPPFSLSKQMFLHFDSCPVKRCKPRYVVRHCRSLQSTQRFRQRQRGKPSCQNEPWLNRVIKPGSSLIAERNADRCPDYTASRQPS